MPDYYFAGLRGGDATQSCQPRPRSQKTGIRRGFVLSLGEVVTGRASKENSQIRLKLRDCHLCVSETLT